MATFKIVGDHDENTIRQFHRCLEHESAIAGVLCADGHLGYSQPVGAAIAYEGHVSVSGVGYDIACGNYAVQLPIRASEIQGRIPQIVAEVNKRISFGIGRTNNNEKVEAEVFDNDVLWEVSGAKDLKDKAYAQFGTVGGGNHYVDIFAEVNPETDEPDGDVWVGVHFGSRGLGHTLATRYLKLAGGKDGIDVPPTLLHYSSELGNAYLHALDLCNQYADQARQWVTKTVSDVIEEGLYRDRVVEANNHHNWAWAHPINGRKAFIARKGCTSNDDWSFVGGSMGDDSVILAPKGNQEEMLWSTIHGAGRTMGRKQAKRVIQQSDVNDWLQRRNVYVSGADLDESPLAYRRLDDVLEYHKDTVEVMYRLRPMAVMMAGKGEHDPWKD